MIDKLFLILIFLYYVNCNNEQPNILFFLADDMGYGDIGYLQNKYNIRKIFTPNLDKLVLKGVRFYNAYTGAPVCAPSRCALITGKHRLVENLLLTLHSFSKNSRLIQLNL